MFLNILEKISQEFSRVPSVLGSMKKFIISLKLPKNLNVNHSAEG